MRIGDTGGAGLGRGPAHHEARKVHHGLLAPLLLLLIFSQAFLQELVDDKMYDGFTNAPPGGRHALPETTNTLQI